jgi:hypothetical protein
VQVGTSRDSSVSGGADYPFTLAQLGEYCFSVVAPAPARVHHSGELDDPNQAFSTSMSAVCHQLANRGKALEVLLLAG